jgi:LuxR family transcriptional regulator, maltose regulon positive regulatory protein
MTRPVLETKLHLPTWRKGLIARPRLLERLNRGAGAKLTLVSAPAGFGKTTLLGSWLASGLDRELPAAWLSLDQSDNHPPGFWTYVIAALQRVAPGVGAESLVLLDASESAIEPVLGVLLNDLSALAREVVLVLDDYHLIDAREIHDQLVFLLEHLPPQLHLVIASRADPALPLARLRVRGDLVELRAADLRFTADEAAAYLDEAMGLSLSADDVAALEERTEGWIAALQLAALSMQGRDDVAGFIAGFAGDDRYIVDYLVEEVLERQPEEVRNFLLRTSILDRLNGALCDAVTGLSNGKAQLEALERRNLFVVPLDDRRRWYRYHHLFADVLRAHLADDWPRDVHQLHRRASAWYEQNGELRAAIHHAFAAGDFSRAADLVELAWPELRNRREEDVLCGWLAALPDEVLRGRPVLSNAYAGVLLSIGKIDGVDARLRDAERWLDFGERHAAEAAGMVVVDENEFRTLPGSVALHRAGSALARGDLAKTAQHARRALDLAVEDDHLSRGGATALLGLAAWATGDLETAYQTYARGMADVRRSGHIAGVFGSAINLADIRIGQGRLRDAMRTYEQALRLAAPQGGAVLRGTSDMYVGMSELYREWNDLDAATRALHTSRELGEHAGFPQNPSRWRVTMARIREAQDDPNGALDLLQQAERVYQSDLSPNVRPIAALKARLLVRHGRASEALGWAREQGLSTADDLTYLREFEHITLAGALVASDSAPEALGLLDRLLHAAEEGGRNGSAIDILLVQALGLQSLGETSAALAALERAVSMAEPEGYVRTFVDEGAPMAILIQAAAKRRHAPGYVQQLLTAFGTAGHAPPARPALMKVESLSERELDVLRLLATDLDGPEIANRLIVSLNTVRTHTKSIYSKLGVNNRRAAVRRAEELELLSQTSRR